MSLKSVLECRKVNRSFLLGDEEIHVLIDIDLDIKAGQMVSIAGTSGSGKTTLLNVLAGLDIPNQGDVLMVDQSLSALSDRERARLRNQNLGFVFQFHHLLPEFSALENVLMPCRINGKLSQQQTDYAKHLLERVGLAARIAHRPGELSGGERQRVAIARALIHRPAVLLMDEPTGNLDEGNSEQVQILIEELNKEFNSSFVVVTHNLVWAKRMAVQYQIRKGRIEILSD